MRRGSGVRLWSTALTLILVTVAFADDEKILTPAQTITIAELRDHIFFLASDELAGRMTGSEGYRTAARYCATQFRAAGLQPLAASEDGEMSFLQPFPLTSFGLGESNSLIVTAGGEEHEFEHGEKYLLFRPGELGEKGLPPSPLVFIGYGIHEPDYGWDDYAELDVEGTIAIALLGAPMRDGKPALPEKKHKLYSSMYRGPGLKLKAAAKRGAKAVMFVPNMQLAMAWGMIRNMVTRGNVSYPSSDTSGSDFPRPTILLHADVVKLLFEGRDFDPLSFKGEYQTFALEGASAGLKIDMTRSEFNTHNVVALVPGTDPELSKQYITIGAHLDHVGERDGNVFNGADDNASGSVAVLEVAEAVAMSPPRRSVIFVLYAGEELGLYGSRFFTDNPPVPLEEIMVNINLDMIGRDDKQFPEGVYALGSAKTCPELKETLIAVNGRTVGLPLDFRLDEHDPQNFFQRSDQVNFHNHGIPVVFFHSGVHPDYHQPGDDAEKINFGKLQRTSRLIYELVMELGNRDEALCAGK